MTTQSYQNEKKKRLQAYLHQTFSWINDNEWSSPNKIRHSAVCTQPILVDTFSNAYHQITSPPDLLRGLTFNKITGPSNAQSNFLCRVVFHMWPRLRLKNFTGASLRLAFPISANAYNWTKMLIFNWRDWLKHSPLVHGLQGTTILAIQSRKTTCRWEMKVSI